MTDLMALKRKQARQRKTERRMLVHAAGCVEPNCLSKWFKDWTLRADPECQLMPGTRIPRSLRRVFGFTVATDSD